MSCWTILPLKRRCPDVLKKLLLIDDEPSLTEILSQFLLRLGYSSDTAPSGNAAVELAAKNQYWAVFCDLKMPGMNGLELFEKIRDLRSDQTRRFVLFTGSILDAESESLVARNRIMVCRKPFNFESIKETLRSLERVS